MCIFSPYVKVLILPLLACIILLYYMVYLRIRARIEKVRAIFEQVLQKRGGRILASRFFYPIYIMDYLGGELSVAIQDISPADGGGEICVTQLKMRLPQESRHTLWISIRRVGIINKVATFSAIGKSSPLDMGNADFSKRMIVSTSDPVFARRVLTEEVQQKILSLAGKYNISWKGAFSVRLRKKEIALDLPVVMFSSDDLDSLIEFLLSFYEKLKREGA